MIGRRRGRKFYYSPGEILRGSTPPNWRGIVPQSIRVIPGVDVGDSTKGEGGGLSLSYLALPYQLNFLFRLYYITI